MAREQERRHAHRSQVDENIIKNKLGGDIPQLFVYCSESLGLDGRHRITRKETGEIVFETGRGWLYSLLLVLLFMLLRARGFSLGRWWLNRHGLWLGVGGL